MKAPTRIETPRLLLRKPTLADADNIYKRYASDREVTRYVGWPRHTSLDDTRSFLAISDAEWEQWPAGPYLVENPATGLLLGGTGLGFEAESTASTGYVLAEDAWGQGFATEALTAMVTLAHHLGIHHLFALCHVDHHRSAHVLEKCGFHLERTLEYHFPNLAGGCLAPCHRYTHPQLPSATPSSKP